MTSTNTPDSPRPPSLDEFREIIRAFGRENDRDLPWRRTTDPYGIFVSEIMLQQTGVERVRAKYAELVAAYPDFGALAAAPLADILRIWRGLGYNRRAVYLKRAAELIVAEHGSELPRAIDALRALPGVGPYTASAIAAFAFGQPGAFIETNIRRVFIHFFFPGRTDVRDRELMPFIEKTVDRDDPRAWYLALMDYGVMLKRTEGGNPNRRSAHYVRQGAFEGSNRQLRGRIVGALGDGPRSVAEIASALGADADRVAANLRRMADEGLVTDTGGGYAIA